MIKDLNRHHRWRCLGTGALGLVFIVQSDLKDYFYTLQLPVSLRRIFSLPAIPDYMLRQWGDGAEHGGHLLYTKAGHILKELGDVVVIKSAPISSTVGGRSVSGQSAGRRQASA